MARADHVGAFADDQRTRALLGFDDVDAGVHRAMRGISRTAWRFALNHLRDGANVLFGGAAAAAYHVQPATIDEALELLREGGGRFLIETFFVRQASVGIAGDEAAGERLQCADVVGHELRTGGAI